MTDQPADLLRETGEVQPLGSVARLQATVDLHAKALRWACWSWADGRRYPEPPCPTNDEFATVQRAFGYEPWDADWQVS